MSSALAILKACWEPLLVIALMIGALVFAWHRGDQHGALAGRLQVAELTASQASTMQHLAELATRSALAARDAEHAQAEAMTAIAAKYEQDKTHAKATSDAVVAGLRAGNLRLRQQWTCPAPAIGATDLSAPGSAPTGPDADAALRNQDAGDLVRIAAEADAQVSGLQRALKTCTAGRLL